MTRAVIPGPAKQEPGISRFRVRVFNAPRNDEENYDSRISSNRRPSFFSNFFTELEAAISPSLA